MQRKRYITLFFIFISMVMLVVPVIPHHHHNNGLICMKNDITPNCCGQQHTPDSEHCCCDTGCVTTHFFQQTPSSDNGWTHPDSTGYHIILRTPSQTIGPPRRKRAKTGLHIPGVTSWHVSHTCHRTSRTSVCSYFIVKSATLLQAFISNFAHR